MTRNISLLLIFWISCTVAYGQDAATLHSKKIVQKVDQYPTYPGGQSRFIRDFQKEFTYPVSIFVDNLNPPREIYLDVVIDKEGNMISPKASSSLGERADELVMSESIRVLKLLKRWNPGITNGKPVSVKYSVSIPVLDEKRGFTPFGYQQRYDAADRIVDRNKVYKAGVQKNQVYTAIQHMELLKPQFPLNLSVNISIARLYGALGEYSKAKEQLSDALEEYSRLGTGYPTLGIYQPNKFADGLMLLSAISDLMQSDTMVNNYEETFRQLKRNLEKTNDADMLQKSEQYMDNYVRNIMSEKYQLVITYPELLNEFEVEDLKREQNLYVLMNMIDQHISKGKISNARVIQITKELQDLRKDVVKLSDEKQMLGYLKQKSLLVWLSQGYDAKKNYLQSLLDSNDLSKTIKSSVSRLMADDRRLGADKVSHTELLRTFVSVAPVQSGNRKDDKALADRFYQVKKMLSPYVK